jgi:hypothetical protein
MNDQKPGLPARTDMDFGFGKNVSPSLQVFLNENLFDRARTIAGYMSKAEGVMPKHLVGKMEACFAVFTRAVNWKLDPFMVAAATYQTPGGSIGYEGKLCQAILENSGMIEGSPDYVHFHDVRATYRDESTKLFRSYDTDKIEQARKDGAKVDDCNRWEDIAGKFHMEQSSSGRGKYAVADWTTDDEDGLGVRVITHVRGETKPRTFDFLLVQAQPRNSTLWATDPMTQICYLAIRRFCSVRAPGLFMGVPFDREDWTEDMRARNARDVTPPRRPSSADVPGVPVAADEAPEDKFELVDEAGAVYVTCPTAELWIKELLAATAPTIDHNFTKAALGILMNNADAVNNIVPECRDNALVGKLLARYAHAEEWRIEHETEPAADQTGHGEGPAGDGPAESKAPAAPEAAQAEVEPKPVEPAKPPDVPAAAEAKPAPTAEPPKPMAFPTDAKIRKPSAQLYLVALQDEMLLATQVAHIDALLEREKPNIQSKAVSDGTRRSISLFAARCKHNLAGRA